MRLISTLTLIASVLLTSCSTITYKEPETGSKARVRFVTDLQSVAVLRAYDDESCSSNETEWLRLRNGYLLNSSPKKLGMPLWNYHDNAAKEIFVDSNKQLNALFSGSEKIGNTAYSCGVPFFYNFAANSDYEVYFRWSKSSCNVVISELTKTSSGALMVEKEKFTNQTTSKNTGCMKAFSKVRLY